MKRELPTIPGKKKAFKQEAAIVAVVDWEGKVLYKVKIFRPFGSYVVDDITTAINGIGKNTLQSPECLLRKFRIGFGAYFTGNSLSGWSWSRTSVHWNFLLLRSTSLTCKTTTDDTGLKGTMKNFRLDRLFSTITGTISNPLAKSMNRRWMLNTA